MTALAGRLVNRAGIVSRLHNACRSWVSRNQIHMSILLENRLEAGSTVTAGT